MAVFTYWGNLDPNDGTAAIKVASGTIGIGEWGEISQSEYNLLSQRYDLRAGELRWEPTAPFKYLTAYGHRASGATTAASTTGGGSVVRAGTGTPSDLIGGNGDLFFDKTKKVLLGPKVSGTWTGGEQVSLVGSDPFIGQTLLRKLNAGQGGVVMVIGDSTTDGAGEWAELMANELAAQYPTTRVETVTWIDGETTWRTPTVIQAGDGAHGTLTVYNASVAGKETHYFLAPNFDAMIATKQPDLIFINLGHNENTAEAEPFWHDDLLAMGETISLYCPRAEIAVVTQNPRADTSATAAQKRRDMTAVVARMRGWGFIDTYRALILANGTVNTALLSDGVEHPNAEGHALIWGLIKERFFYVPGAVSTAQPQSSFAIPSTTPLLNASFAEFAVPPTLTSWTATQATLSRDATNFQGPNGYSVRMVQASAATSYIEQAITGNAAKPYLGRVCTFVAWVRRQVGASANAGRVHMRTTGGSNLISLNSFATSQGQGDFIPISISGRVDKSAGTITVRIYCENGTTGTQDVSVDRCWFGSGPLPRDLR